MAKSSTSKTIIELIEKIVNLFFKSSRRAKRGNTHHQHVVPHEKGWAVRGEGNERLTATYKYQNDAIERAKDIAKNYSAYVIIHRKDGTIRDRISYD
jgi:uncharacterized protein YdaT